MNLPRPAKLSIYFIVLCTHYVHQGKSTPCSQPPCFGHLKSRHSYFKAKRNNPGSQIQTDQEILRPSWATTLRLDSLSKEMSAKLPEQRKTKRSRMGSRRLLSAQLGTKKMPSAYMSTQRYPRKLRASLGQLDTRTDTGKQIDVHGYRREKLKALDWPEEERKSSDDKENASMKQSSKGFVKRGHIMSPWEHLAVHNAQTGTPQGQIIKDAEEYWWKSGYLEGLKKKLEDATQKSDFSSDMGLKEIPAVSNEHFLTRKATGSNVGKTDVLSDRTRYRGNNGISEAGYTGVGQETSSGQTRTVGINQMNGQLGKTRVQLGTFRSEGGTDKGHPGMSPATNMGQMRTSADRNIEQIRNIYDAVRKNIGPVKTSNTGQIVNNRRQWKPSVGTRGQTTTNDDQKAGDNLGNAETIKDTNIDQWRALLGSMTGETRSTEGQSEGSGEQSGTPEGQSGRSSDKYPENDAVQQENAEISKSSPDCSQPVDLALLVDGSGSIDPIRQFPKVRKFLKELAAAFQIGPTKTKIALVQFSGKVSQNVEFGLDQYMDLQGVIGGIDSMVQLRGNTYVGEGFKVVSKEVFSSLKGDRPDVRNVLMLFTDGAASDFDVAKEEAAVLKKNGTTIICVGAGDERKLQFFRSQLQEFASEPPEQYVFTKGFEELDKVVTAVSSITCEEAKNPPEISANASVDVNLNSYKSADHYWAFDVVNGDVVSDLIGSKRCTLTAGAHLFKSVKRNMVCSMVESGGYLDLGTWAGECITDPDLCASGLTITMWLRIQAKDINYNSEYQYIISSGAEGESMRGIVFLLKAKDEIYKLLVRTTGQAWSITLPADRIPSVWFSFAFSWKRALGLAVYLNGFKVEENLKPTNVEGPDVSNSLFIARPATSTGLEYQTKFRIDDFAIFYRFMTDQEVQGILFEVSGPPSKGGADLCTPNPCKHGSCSTDSDTASGFICQCLPGWTGDLCDKGLQTSGESGGETSSQSQNPPESSIGEQASPGQGSQVSGSESQTSEESGGGTTSQSQNPSTSGQGSQVPGGESQNPSTSPNASQSPSESSPIPQQPSPSENSSQSLPQPQSPSTNHVQGVGETPDNNQRPSGSPSGNQAPGQNPPQIPGTTIPQGNPSTASGQFPPQGQFPPPVGQSPPSFSGNTGTSPGGTKQPTGLSPSQAEPQQPGQSPTSRPKNCPPCPEKPGASGNSKVQGMLNLPTNSNPPGTANPPGASNLPGTVNSPRISSSPDSSNAPGTSNISGALNPPGSINPPETPAPPGTPSPPGTPGTVNSPASSSSPGTSSPPGNASPPGTADSSNTAGKPSAPTSPANMPTTAQSPSSSPGSTGTTQGPPISPPKTPSNPPSISTTPKASQTQGTPGTQRPPNTPGSSPQSSGKQQAIASTTDVSNKPNAPGTSTISKNTSKTPGSPSKPNGSTSASGSSDKTKCVPIPPGSSICSTAPTQNMADAAHTYRYRLPPIFGPYDTADDYDCTPVCISDCTSPNCSEACCGTCPPVCRKVCRSDCPSRCCGKDAIIPQRRHAIPRPSRKTRPSQYKRTSSTMRSPRKIARSSLTRKKILHHTNTTLSTASNGGIRRNH